MTIDYKAFYDRLVAEVANPPLLPVVPSGPPPTAVIDTVDALLRACAAGGTYDLKPGDYTGNFVVQRPLTLTGDGQGRLLPADPLLPTLFVPEYLASMSLFDRLTIVGGAPDRETVVIGQSDATDPDAQPYLIMLRDCTVLAGPKGGHRGIALHGRHLTVDNCRITGFWEVGRDSQGIWGNNGAGPYMIKGNYIEASGENILFGGSDPGIVGMIPSDITIRGNTLVKPASYKSLNAQVKNSLELKNARRVTIENNTIDGWWPPNQAAPVQFTPRNQDGNAPWCVVEDVTFTGNVIKNAPGGFAINILGTDNDNPSGQTKNITISRNLFTDSQAGIQMLGGVGGQLVIDHNTFPAIKSKLFSFDRIAGTPDMLTQLWFTNNVAKAGTYGVTGDGSTAIGLESLKAFCDLVDWSGNLIGGPSTIKWPAGQAVLTNAALMALLDPVTFKTLNGTGGY